MATTLNTTVIQRKKKHSYTIESTWHVRKRRVEELNEIAPRKSKSQTQEMRGGVKLSFSFRQCRNKLNPALCRFAFHVYTHTCMQGCGANPKQLVILDTTCLSCRTARFATTVHMPYHAHCQSETRSS